MITYDVVGIYVPKLMVDALLAAFLSVLAAQVLGRLGLYRHVWHPALFNICLFIIVLAFLAVPPSQWWS